MFLLLPLNGGVVVRSRDALDLVFHLFSFAVDVSSASEDDLDSEDSEQDIKSCSHCGTTSEYKSVFVIYQIGEC